ncbi:protein SCO1/2 [Oceanobacillus limi]|uniref:Protein SCO1/2 n=1 Tax=Oceanobacillus limi TaxID=930131 RepID=A0A1I0C3A8_9BACI|nr:SCO family protein [Oceanobacillus limi]SET13949.1 protein SCO1/2 [Oceanobacillus limi]
MIKKRHNTVAIVVVLLFGFGVFYFGTDGFQAFTAETARTNKLIEEKPQFPNVTFEDSKERVYTFDEFENKYVFITFLYTACTDVCPQLEMNMHEVYQRLPVEAIGEDIVFLSISFDPEQDDPRTLEKYRGFFGSDGDTWRMARIPDQAELDRLLDEFGVIVIPEENGIFTHNSAFYLVNREGQLEEVMDYTKPEEAAAKVEQYLQDEAGDE